MVQSEQSDQDGASRGHDSKNGLKSDFHVVRFDGRSVANFLEMTQSMTIAKTTSFFETNVSIYETACHQKKGHLFRYARFAVGDNSDNVARLSEPSADILLSI
jgi:hypothetical protein